MEQNQIEQSLRLKKLMKALNLNQSLFAKSLGVTQPNISRMVSGESKISAEILSRITGTYKQLNLHWLLTGDGEMFLYKTNDTITQVNEEYAPKGKGKLEDLEERVERLEAAVRRLLKDGGK
jgi:transcriptional regulator with XRE-family HTH domain